jgi:hypothetical protein
MEKPKAAHQNDATVDSMASDLRAFIAALDRLSGRRSGLPLV